jgi:hypothetical protein
MKLDRNINPDGTGKYALVLMREFFKLSSAEKQALYLLASAKVIDHGDTPNSEFFVIRLKDRYAAPALAAYALAASEDDPEYGSEIMELAKRAVKHPSKKKPD